jgi:prepilin-type N-terminal cleavage/methylation domain-containing protein
MRQLSRGFSLLELLVVITISAIIFSVGLAAYSSIQTQQSIKSTTKLLESTLNRAKEEAIFGKKPAACSNRTLLGKKVQIREPVVEGAGIDIILYSVCLFPALGTISNIEEEVFNLDPGVEVSIPYQGWYFSSVKSGTVGIPSSLNEIVYQISFGDVSSVVVVDKFGNIKVISKQ